MRAAILMTLSMLAFTVNDTFMKLASEQLPLFQALFLRGLMTVAVLGALAWRAGALRAPPAPADRPWVALRTLGEMGAAAFFVAALFSMPLANATAIFQALPLTVTLAAALLLGERVGARRWAAIAVGFCGVLLMVRPGAAGFGWPSVFALMAVLSITLRDVATRRMSEAAAPLMLSLAAAVGVTVMAGLALPFSPRVPVTGAATAMLVGSAAAIMTGYVMSVVVMRAGDVSVTAPFRYTALLWALAAGLVVFGDWPDPLTLAGAAIVVGAGLMTIASPKRPGAAARTGPR